jgi:hypothetical protein
MSNFIFKNIQLSYVEIVDIKHRERKRERDLLHYILSMFVRLKLTYVFHYMNFLV